MGSDNLGAMKIKVPTDTISTAGRTAEDLALGALIGGNLFGRVAMHPALTDVSDQAERGKVLNRAWRRYGNVESLALATLDIPAYAPDALPPELAAIPAVKPGSRALAGAA